MANKATKEEKKPRLLPQFVGFMSDLDRLSDASLKADMSKTHLPELNEAGEKALRGFAYEYGKDYVAGFSPALTPTPDALSGEEVAKYIKARQSQDIRFATRIVSSSLDSLVNELSDKALENGARDKDLVPFVDDAAQAWYIAYQQVQGAKDLVERAENGALKKEEKEQFTKARAAELREKKFNDLLAKTGNDKYLAGLGADAHAASFLAGHVEDPKEYFTSAAKRNAELIEGALREYEAKSKVNARTYMQQALKGLAEKDINKARDKLYNLAKE